MPLAITVSQNLRLKVLLVFVWLSSVEPRKISRFLFVGQSNMEGNVVNDPGSLRFDQTMDILLSSGSDERIRNEMVEHLKTAISSPPTPESVYEFEAVELLRLKNAGLLTDSFQQPLPTVTCSFYQLDLQVDYNIPSKEGKL
jgi:nitrate/nitrite-specific signal transduction histidine kinase